MDSGPLETVEALGGVGCQRRLPSDFNQELYSVDEYLCFSRLGVMLKFSFVCSRAINRALFEVLFAVAKTVVVVVVVVGLAASKFAPRRGFEASDPAPSILTRDCVLRWFLGDKT